MTSAFKDVDIADARLEAINAVPEWIGRMDDEESDRVVIQGYQPFFKVHGSREEIVSSFEVLRQALDSQSPIYLVINWETRELFTTLVERV